ncbi:MAG: uracil-DNA glycosylase [Rikenellaceae bacterium]
MITIPKSWIDFALEERDKDYYKPLSDFIKSEYASAKVYPPENLVFSALKYCAPEQVKVVIIGQDPYHGEGQANGLSFSVSDGIMMPPSLKNIFKEVCSDMGVEYPKSGNLQRWATQGVLMLNASLTVRCGEPLSHSGKGWEQMTDDLISYLSATQKHIVYILWGGYAKRKIKLIDQSNNLILTANHPSPLSANRGGFFGCRHFSKANAYLLETRGVKIDW